MYNKINMKQNEFDHTSITCPRQSGLPHKAQYSARWSHMSDKAASDHPQLDWCNGLFNLTANKI